MSILKILAVASICIDLVLIVAYVELHAIMKWYKKQFRGHARAFRYVEKYSWQRRLVDIMLLRRPVTIKQPFKVIELNDGNELGRKTKMAAHCFNSDAVKTSNQLFIHLFRKKGGSME